jgi:hypothetical protein
VLVVASGDPPDHRVKLLWDAARLFMQEATLVALGGNVVGVPEFVLVCHFLVLQAAFVGDRRS